MGRPSLEGSSERASFGARVWVWVPFLLLGGAAAVVGTQVLEHDQLSTVVLLALLAGTAGALFLRPASDAAEPEPASTGPAVPALIDADSGVGNALQLEELLVHEISRCRRHGHPATLAVFDLAVVGFKPGAQDEAPPPYGRYVARVLVDSVRESDYVLRLDESHFAILLTEAPVAGARPVIDRLQTLIGTRAYARNSDGTGVFIRAWAGSAEWQIAFESPAEFVKAALDELERTRPGYEAAQAFFRGTAPAT